MTSNYLTKEGLYLVIFIVVLVTYLYGRKILWFFFSFDKDIEKILYQKKSSEVRLGKVVESIAPLLDDFPVDIYKPGTSTQFLGQPIDFIHFDPEEGITFIEVKSGNAKLSDTQKKIKKAVEERRIKWESYRIK